MDKHLVLGVGYLTLSVRYGKRSKKVAKYCNLGVVIEARFGRVGECFCSIFDLE